MKCSEITANNVINMIVFTSKWVLEENVDNFNLQYRCLCKIDQYYWLVLE